MKYFAYADESGHSGLKLFDVKEDTFWTGTVISVRDLDAKFKAFHNELLGTVQQPELHGNELGLGRIDKIATRLCWFIREKRLRFSFVRVHKPYLGAAKLFDLIFDSGANPAVPWQAYNVQQLRQITVMHFLELLTEEDVREFWALFEAQDTQRLVSLLRAIEARVSCAPFDARTKQILMDSLGWAAAHPDKVLDPFGLKDSPNFVAFSALFQFFHSINDDGVNNTIASFVHDEQGQFVPSFKSAFAYLSVMKGKTHPLATLADVTKANTFECPNLTVAKSSQSFGLQLIDLCLWFVKRVYEQQTPLRGNCVSLMECLQEKSSFNDFSFEAVVQNVSRGAKSIYSRPFTADDEQRAKALLAQTEEQRLARMSAPID
jgi:hypothetical protein